MNVEYDLVIDFARPSKSNTIIISEGDSNSRLLRFILLSNKQAFDMLDVSTATVKGIKTDGTVIYGDATIKTDDEGNKINEVDYTLPSAVSDISGKTTMTITLASTTGEIITSFEFYVQTRNSLYSEDDYISDTDLTGFRDLLNRSNAALQKMEAMTEKEALPNPYPINIVTGGTTYSYTGSEKVDVDLGDVAYYAVEDLNYEDASIDETAAASAAESAKEAKESATQAKASASSAATDVTTVESIKSDVSESASAAATSALNASKSAIAADSSAAEAAETLTTINSVITDKCTTIANQVAGDLIDDIVDETKGYRDAASASATSASASATEAASKASSAATDAANEVKSQLKTYTDSASASATAAANSATEAAQEAASIGVSATQILESGVHIGDITVNGTKTELYAPTADTPATEAKNITYDHTTSGLDASDAQAALDELASEKADKTTTLSGYGITDATISNGTITLGTNTITPLTSHQDISGKANTTETGYSLAVSGTSVSLKNKAGTVLSTITTQDTNTWRGIQNNLTSTSTSDSLSANQGNVLNTKITNIQGTSDAYNSSTSYSLGAVVVYNDIVWSCKTACKGQTPSTSSSYWQQISLKNMPFRFGIDSSGNYGYYKGGADTVTPFKTATSTVASFTISSGVITLGEAITNGMLIYVYRKSSLTSFTEITLSSGSFTKIKGTIQLVASAAWLQEGVYTLSNVPAKATITLNNFYELYDAVILK